MTNFKQDMKIYTIKPIDEDMDVLVDAVDLLNNFKKLGFTTKSGFVGVVQDNIPEYKNYKNLNRLLSFWQSRIKNKELNNQLHKLLNKLKHE